MPWQRLLRASDRAGQLPPGRYGEQSLGRGRGAGVKGTRTGAAAAGPHALHARSGAARPLARSSPSRYFDQDRHDEPVRKPASPQVCL